MREDGHQQRALQFEHAITVLGDPAANPDITVGLIEHYWAAAFHWIAYGCQRKHGQHKENHLKLGRYLSDIGEAEMGTRWNRLERTRQGAMYAYRADLPDVERAREKIGRLFARGQPHDT